MRGDASLSFSPQPVQTASTRAAVTLSSDVSNHSAASSPPSAEISQVNAVSLSCNSSLPGSGGFRGQRSSASSAAIRGSQRTHRALRQIWTRPPRPRSYSLEGRNRQARLRERLQRRLENVARAFKNGDERVPPESPRSQFTENHGRANGADFLRRRRQTPRRLRPPKRQRLSRKPLSLSTRQQLQKDPAAGSGRRCHSVTPASRRDRK